MVSLGAIRSIFAEIAFVNKATKPIADLNKQIEATKKNIEKNTKAIRESLLAAGATLTGIGVAGGFFFKGATKDLADYMDGMTTFRKSVEEMGLNVDTMLAKIQEMSGGTVASVDAIRASNVAMLMGIDPGKLPRMMEIARAAARATGNDVTFMFDSISKGTVRESKLILDNLGIEYDMEEAYKRFAKQLKKNVSALTDEERAMATQQLVMEKGQEIIDKVDLSQESLNEEMARNEVQWRELKMEIARGALPIIKELISKLKWLLDYFRGLPEPIKNVIGTVGILVTVTAAILGPLALMTAAILFLIPQIGTAALVFSGLTAAEAAMVLPTIGLTGAFGTLAGAIWAALVPILPFIVAGAALILIIQDLWVGLHGGRSVVKDFIGWLNNLYEKLGPLRYVLLPITAPIEGIKAVVWAFQHWREIPGIVSDAFGGLWDYLTSLPARLFEAGAGLFKAFIEGLKSVPIIGPIVGTLDIIRSYLPFSDAKIGPLADLTLSGQRFMETFAKGAQLALPAISSPVAGIGSMISGTMGAAGSMPAPISISVTITGNTISGDEASLKTMATMTANEVEKTVMRMLNLQAKRAGI